MAEPTILKDRVIELERTVPEIYKQLGVMDARTDTISRNAEEIRRAIYGFNGTVGLLHKVHTLEEKMSDIKKLIWTILVIVLGIAIEGIYLALQHVLAAP